MGTWKIAMMATDRPNAIYFVKNSGNFIIGKEKNSIVVSSEDAFYEGEHFKGDMFKVPNNHLIELKEDLSYSLEKLDKKI